MKRGTPNHPKLYELMAHLEIPRYAAVGILESLWHFAQGYAQAGDIGRHTDEAIARAVGWEGNAASLMSALAKAGWVDRCSCHRVRVHDWPQHADQQVKRYVHERTGFAPCYANTSETLAFAELPSPAVAVAVALPKPSPSPPQSGDGAALSPQEYIRQIEAAFLSATGRPETQGFDNTEYVLCRKWHEQRIPLRIVLRAFQDTKGAAQARRLHYFGPSVEDAAKHWQRAVGA